MENKPDCIPSDWIAIEFTVRREHSGWRADLYVANRIPRLSRSKVQKILKKSGFDQNGHRLKPNTTLYEGERIVIFRPPPKEPDVPRRFGVLFEDEWILAVDKPAGLPVHPTARYHRNTLTGLLRDLYGDDKPIIGHRLDRETSGVLLCAKSSECEKSLKAIFAERKVVKHYLAVVHGVPSPAQGRIEAPIGPDSDSPVRIKMACREDGAPSLTEYRVVEELPERAAVECLPRTGRQHQIRVHLQHLGYPIIGDKMYGHDPTLFLDYVEQGSSDEIVRRAGFQRQALHASSVLLPHPVTGKDLYVESPMPDDIRYLLG